MTNKRIALVTGGTRGIGASIVKNLHDAGYDVYANYNSNDEAANAFKKEYDVNVIKFDVSNYADVTKAMQALPRVDILVNNAGITRDAFLHKMNEADWDSVMDTNLKSAFNVTRAVINGMRERAWGRIVNIGSINAQKGQIGQTNYCAAKAGLIGFTKALALESARKNITVNTICPGYIDTDMTAAIPHDILQGIIATIPTGRMGKPEEIASLVGYLVSEEASFTTGAVFAANGGQYMG